MQALYHLPDTLVASVKPGTRTKSPPVQPKVHVFDMALHPWQSTTNPGLALKPVRHDDRTGNFLGLVKFDAFARSGLHQHQGLATSFVIAGGLTDYHGPIDLHHAGINLAGATHDAIAYRPTLLVSRLEAPVSYPPNSAISGVHAGSMYKSFQNPDPKAPPEINVSVDSLKSIATGYAGVTRQLIFNYEGLRENRRFLQLSVLPKSSLSFEASALTEFWVRGGNFTVNGIEAHANCFVVAEAGAAVTIDSPFGALLLAWAEGPEARYSKKVNLFGF